MSLLSVTELECGLALSRKVEGALPDRAGTVSVHPDSCCLVVVDDDPRLGRCTRKLPARLVRTTLSGHRARQSLDQAVRTISRQMKRRHGYVRVHELRLMEDSGIRVLAHPGDSIGADWKAQLAVAFPEVRVHDTRSSRAETHVEGVVTTWIEAQRLDDKGFLEELGGLLEATLDSVPPTKPPVSNEWQRVDGRTRELDCELGAFAESIRSLTIQVPENAVEEEKAFFESKCCRPPHYEYARSEFDPARVLQRLHALPIHELPEGPFAALLSERRRELAAELGRVLAAEDPQYAFALARERFGEPSASLVAQATRILTGHSQRNSSPDSLREIAAGKAKKRLASYVRRVAQRAGRDFDIDCCLVRGLPAKASPGLRTLALRSGRRFSNQELRSLAVGMLGGTLLRQVNGARQPLALFAHGLPGAAATSTGFAPFVAERAGLLIHDQLERMAARVVVVHRLLSEHTFVDCFGSLVDEFGMAKRDAYLVCQEVFQYGGTTEPALQLAGFVSLRKAALDDADVHLLGAGVIGLGDLESMGRGIRQGLLREGVFRPADPETVRFSDFRD